MDWELILILVIVAGLILRTIEVVAIIQNCPFCKKEIARNATVCPYCGRALSPTVQRPPAPSAYVPQPPPVAKVTGFGKENDSPEARKAAYFAKKQALFGEQKSVTFGRVNNSEIVAESIWLNLLDGHEVCEICRPLHGKPTLPIAAQYGEPPIHIGCQCYIVEGTRRKGK
jgi:hypothetical protein